MQTTSSTQTHDMLSLHVLFESSNNESLNSDSGCDSGLIISVTSIIYENLLI